MPGLLPHVVSGCLPQAGPDILPELQPAHSGRSLLPQRSLPSQKRRIERTHWLRRFSGGRGAPAVKGGPRPGCFLAPDGVPGRFPADVAATCCISVVRTRARPPLRLMAAPRAGCPVGSVAIGQPFPRASCALCVSELRRRHPSVPISRPAVLSPRLRPHARLCTSAGTRSCSETSRAVRAATTRSD